MKGLFLAILSVWATAAGWSQSANGLLLQPRRGEEARAEALGARLVSKRWRIYALEGAGRDWAAELKELRRADWLDAAQLDLPAAPRNRTPNDTYYLNGALWHLDLVGAAAAWQHTTGGQTALGDEIVVAIIDGGCDLSHADLAPNLWKNRQEIPNNGLDDDQNGYIDDFDGWNVAAQNDSLPAEMHGTGVIGLAGAVGDNGAGVVGINWRVKIMPLLASYSGTSISQARVIAAYDYIATMRQLYEQSGGAHGAYIVATNASFGIDGADAADYPLWCAVYDDLGRLGILSVAATTNSLQNVDFVGDMPTTCGSDYLLAVTETTRQEQLNAGYGPINIDLSAPANAPTTRPNNQYGNLGGTSAASPLVAASVALLHAYPDSTWAAYTRREPAAAALFIKKLLLEQSDELPALVGKTAAEGRLNIGRAMAALDELYAAPMETQFLGAYPNPTRNTLYIKTAVSTPDAQQIRLFDALGRLVLEREIAATPPHTMVLELDASGLADGIYFLEWSCGDSKAVARFVKIP